MSFSYLEGSNHLLRTLLKAYQLLTPIVDKIYVSALKYGKSKRTILTLDEYDTVIWVSNILKEVEFELNQRSQCYCVLPNSVTIVNNLKFKRGNGENIVIDEATMSELVDLYDQLGDVINRMLKETGDNKRSDFVKSTTDTECGCEAFYQSDNKYTADSECECGESDFNRSVSCECQFEDSDDDDLEPCYPDTCKNLNKRRNNYDSPRTYRDNNTETCNPDTCKYLTARTNSYKYDSDPNEPCYPNTCKNLRFKQTNSQNDVAKVPKGSSNGYPANDNASSIIIRIKCFDGDNEESENETEPKRTDASTSCPNCDASPIHKHMQLNGSLVTLKLNQVGKNSGTMYCINAGSDEADNIRILIKQCPKCSASVIASSARIKTDLDEPLHGQRDEASMTFSSDEGVSKRRPVEKVSKGCMCTREKSISKASKGCMCDKVESASNNQGQLNLLVNLDNLECSTIQVNVRGNKSKVKVSKSPEARTDEGGVSCPKLQTTGPRNCQIDKCTCTARSKTNIGKTKNKPKMVNAVPPQRVRVCSSMEFDVATVHTKLRDKEMQNSNRNIVVELKKMGVNQLLRACRPAKCCRKAILGERQKVALPYSVSLRSLPLRDEDLPVIQQSIDMSVKRVKDSSELDKTTSKKTSYYVNLTRDKFKPEVNFPWVLPAFNLKYFQKQNSPNSPNNIERNEVRYVLKKTKCVRFESEAKKYYVLKQIKSENAQRINKEMKLFKKSKVIRLQEQEIQCNIENEVVFLKKGNTKSQLSLTENASFETTFSDCSKTSNISFNSKDQVSPDFPFVFKKFENKEFPNLNNTKKLKRSKSDSKISVLDYDNDSVRNNMEQHYLRTSFLNQWSKGSKCSIFIKKLLDVYANEMNQVGLLNFDYFQTLHCKFYPEFDNSFDKSILKKTRSLNWGTKHINDFMVFYNKCYATNTPCGVTKSSNVNNSCERDTSRITRQIHKTLSQVPFKSFRKRPRRNQTIITKSVARLLDMSSTSANKTPKIKKPKNTTPVGKCSTLIITELTDELKAEIDAMLKKDRKKRVLNLHNYGSFKPAKPAANTNFTGLRNWTTEEDEENSIKYASWAPHLISITSLPKLVVNQEFWGKKILKPLQADPEIKPLEDDPETLKVDDVAQNEELKEVIEENNKEIEDFEKSNQEVERINVPIEKNESNNGIPKSTQTELADEKEKKDTIDTTKKSGKKKNRQIVIQIGIEKSKGSRLTTGKQSGRETSVVEVYRRPENCCCTRKTN